MRNNGYLDNLKELKKKSGMSSKQIAEGTLMPERTICRIFNGETSNPTITTLIPIIKFLGGSISEIFADTKAIVGDQNLAALQESVLTLTAERDSAIAENLSLKEQVSALTNELLKTQLTHKDEIISLYKLLYRLQNADTKGEL
jgi:transcriptional regulator with XRE-family HTH domain